MALDSPDAFFPFLDAVTNEALLSQSLTPEAIYNAGLQIAATKGFLSEPGALAAVELNLGLHSATPKIEAFYQYYRDTYVEKLIPKVPNDDCGSWVDWYGEVVCDIESLVRLAGRETLDPPGTSAQNS